MLDAVAESGDAEKYVQACSREATGSWASAIASTARRIRARACSKRTAKDSARRASRPAEALEKAAIAALRERHPDRPLETNVEFWGAVVLEIARVPAAITPALFACARTGGWSAHIVEQKLTGPADPAERGLRRPVRATPLGRLVEALDRASDLLAAWQNEVLRELPQDVEIFDAHVHLGDDIDGMRGRPEELLGMMDDYGVGRAFMFCLDEPDRHPGFRAPNDRTLAYAEESGGRLIPFVRLDLNEDPIEEANRCIDAGARGIKLHPRAQKISLQDERLDARVPARVRSAACRSSSTAAAACRRSRRTCTRSSSAARACS